MFTFKIIQKKIFYVNQYFQVKILMDNSMLRNSQRKNVYEITTKIMSALLIIVVEHNW